MSLEVERGGGLERAAVDRKRGVVGAARANDKRVGERVTGIDVGGGELAHRRARGGVLRNGVCREGDVRRCLVDVRDRDRKCLLRVQAAGIGGADSDGVAASALEVERGGSLERAAVDRERSVVGAALA